MIRGEGVIALLRMARDQKLFGPVPEWDVPVVTQWVLAQARLIRDGASPPPVSKPRLVASARQESSWFEKVDA